MEEQLNDIEFIGGIALVGFWLIIQYFMWKDAFKDKN